MSLDVDLDRIDHVHVFVRDRARAEAWYRETLGLAPIAELASWASNGGPLMLGNASRSIQLALFERPAKEGRTVVAFGVAGPAFDAWRRHLAEALGRPLDPVDHELCWSLYFSDPDGNAFELTTYDRTR